MMMIPRSRSSSTASNSSVQETREAEIPASVNPFFDEMSAFCHDIKLLSEALDEIEKSMVTVQEDSLPCLDLESLKKDLTTKVMLPFAQYIVKNNLKSENIDIAVRQKLRESLQDVVRLIREVQNSKDLFLLNLQIGEFSHLKEKIQEILDSSKIEAGGSKEGAKVVAPSALPRPKPSAPPCPLEFFAPLYPDPSAPLYPAPSAQLYPAPSAQLYPAPSAQLYPAPSAPSWQEIQTIFEKPIVQQPIDTPDKMTTAKSKQDILEALTFKSDCRSNGLEQFIKCLHQVQDLVNQKRLTMENVHNPSVSNLMGQLKATNALEKDSDLEIKNFLSDLVNAATHKDSLPARLNRKTYTIIRMIEKTKARINEISKGIRNTQGHSNSLGKYIEQGTLLNKEYKYTGKFQDSVPHGLGVFEYTNGDRYEGNCENGKPNGDGILIFRDGGQYKGKFQNGKYHGHGELISRNGDRYEGKFKDGEYHGTGTLTNANEEVFTVEFRNGRILSCTKQEPRTEMPLETQSDAQKDKDVKSYTAPKTRHEMMMTKAQSFSKQELTLNPECDAIQFKQFLGFIEYVQDLVNKKVIKIEDFEIQNSSKVPHLIAELKKSKNTLSFLSEASDQVITDFLSKLVIDATHKDFISAKLNKNTATINKIIKQIKSQFVVGFRGKLGGYTGQKSQFVVEFRGDIGAYTGHVNSEGKAHGKGTYTWPSGAVYEGYWKDGDRHGNGKHTKLNGEVYDGQWVNDERHGLGTQTLRDKKRSCFIGEWRNNKPYNGQGGYIYPDESYYKGDWKDGKRHGKGKYTDANRYDPRRNVYEGDWEDDKMHGKGIYVFASGGVYNGEIKKGKSHGKGKQTFANGNVYDGDWNNGDMHGKGIYIHTYTTGEVYDGQFVNNFKHGNGITTFTNGKRYQETWSGGRHTSYKELSSKKP